MVTTLSSRMVQKHDLEVNWLTATDFIPLQGEFIIYDIEVDADGKPLALPEGRTAPYTYARLKIGDGLTSVNKLPFIDETLNIEELIQAKVQTYVDEAILGGAW